MTNEDLDRMLRERMRTAAATTAAEVDTEGALRRVMNGGSVMVVELEERRTGRGRRTVAVATGAAAAVVALVLGIWIGGRGGAGVDDDGGDPADSPTTAPVSTAPPSTGAPSTVPPTTGDVTTTSVAPPESAALDWDGTEWDVGSITKVERAGERVVVTFDRYTWFYDPADTEVRGRTAPDFSTKPLTYGNTDVATQNTSTTLRRYVLADGATLTRIANVADTCADLDSPVDPEWRPFALDDLLHDGAKAVTGGAVERGQVVLTFDDVGRVTEIQVSDGC